MRYKHLTFSEGNNPFAGSLYVFDLCGRGYPIHGQAISRLAVQAYNLKTAIRAIRANPEHKPKTFMLKLNEIKRLWEAT